MRMRNTNQKGEHWSKRDINLVWKKGFYIPGQNFDKFRKDAFGAIMEFCKFGNTNDIYGWEIDHNISVELGGTDELSNLQPLNWQNNRNKDASWPYCDFKISHDKVDNSIEHKINTSKSEDISNFGNWIKL